MTRLARWTGRLCCVAGLMAWATWLGWRVASLTPTRPLGVALLGLELAAVGVALVISAGLWTLPDAVDPLGPVGFGHGAHGTAPSSVSTGHRWLPDTVARLLAVDGAADATHGDDDTGEVARARRGARLLDLRTSRPRSWAEATWAVIAVEGMRRMVFVAALVLVLLTGRFPIEVPPVGAAIALVGALALLSIGHWLLSNGEIRPGERLRWSMASAGAGFGDGTSRSGLPIRWATTMATIVVLNLAVSLRGFSDRWTHGLGALDHDERVIAMTVSWWLVAAGFLALRTLPQPTLGYYGANGRLEESTTRRWAIGATLTVAFAGFAAGVLPGSVPA